MYSRRITRAISKRCGWAVTSATALIIALALSQTGSAQTQEDVWSQLRGGGIVLFRHARAPGTGDPADFDLKDCSTQRNLDERGRSDARRIGRAFHEEAVPVAKVLTSQWCRCRETAELAFPGLVEAAPIFNSFFQDRSRGPTQTRQALKLLEDWSGSGALVIVTHQVNITALTGVFPASGEGIAVRMESGELTVLGRLRI